MNRRGFLKFLPGLGIGIAIIGKARAEAPEIPATSEAQAGYNKLRSDHIEHNRLHHPLRREALREANRYIYEREQDLIIDLLDNMP